MNVWMALLLLQPAPAAAPSGTPLPAGAVARCGATGEAAPREVALIAVTAEGGKLALQFTGDPWIHCLGLAPLGVTLDRLAAPAGLTALAWSGDGTRLAAAGPQRGLFLWEGGTGRPPRPLAADLGPFHALAFAPDGRHLYAAGAPRELYGFEATTGRLAWRRDLEQHGVCQVVAGGPYLVVAGAGWFQVWDAARQSILWEERRGSGPYRVALPPDGRWLATADGKGRLQIWEPATGKRFGRCPPLDGDCLGLAFAPDGARVAWAARAGAHTQLGQLDLDTMETQVRQGGGIGLTYLSDGQTLAWVHPTEGLITHGLTGRATQPLYGAAVGIPRGLAFSPDGRTLAVASDEPRLRLFDPATGRMTGAVPGLVGPGDHDRLTWVRFLPDGRTLLGGTWTRAYCWEVATGRPPIGREEAVPRIGNVVVAPDGKTALAIGADLAVWDLTGPLPTPRQVLGDRPRWVRGVAYTPDGARVVAHDWIRDELLVSPLPPPGGSWAFQTVASVPGTTGSPPLLGILAGGQRMAFSHSAGQLAVYDLTTGQAAASFTAPPTGTAWALSPNGRLLAQGDRGGTVRVWDVATWKSRAVFTHGHQDQAITALAWDPAGRRLASGGADKGIIVWDVTAGGKP